MTDVAAPPITDWPAAWEALRNLDGAEWDSEHERLEAAWKAEYTRAFIATATARPGWTRENAEVWAGEIVSDAFVFGVETDPAILGAADVLECEMEAA